MFDLNVLGIVRVTQALLPALRADGGGLVINMGSTAGRIAYEGGGGYTAAKHAVKVLTADAAARAGGRAAAVHRDRARDGQDRGVHAEPVRRATRSATTQVYEGVPEPLVAEDIAEMVRWVASLPAHVNIDELVVRPRAQAAQHKVHRVSDELSRGEQPRFAGFARSGLADLGLPGIRLRLGAGRSTRTQLVPGDLLELVAPESSRASSQSLTSLNHWSASPKVA